MEEAWGEWPGNGPFCTVRLGLFWPASRGVSVPTYFFILVVCFLFYFFYRFFFKTACTIGMMTRRSIEMDAGFS
jgi:hypothetical protein